MSGTTSGSPNLGIVHLAQSQNSAEVTVNSAIDALDNAENAVAVISFASSTTVVLNQEAFTGAQMFRCQGLTASSTLTVPTSMRDFNVRNEGEYPLTVGGATGATVTVPSNTTCGMQNDGTDTVLVTSSAGANPGVQFANQSGNVGGVATLLTVSSKFTLASPSSGAVTLDINTGALGGLAVQGNWNASTNSPALTNTPPAAGQFYVVSTAGSTSITGRDGALAQWNVNDLIMSDGTYWFRVEGNPSTVSSVAGRTGAVTLTVGDVAGAAPAANATLTAPALAAAPAANDDSLLVPSTSWVQSYIASLGYTTQGASGVSSVVGQTGAVTLAELVTAGVAPTQNATLTTPKLATAPAATDNSLAVISSSWVQALKGADNGLAGLGADGCVPWAQMKPEAQNLPIGFVMAGLPGANQVANLPMVMQITVPASLAGTMVYCGTPPTANATFTLSKISGGAATVIGTVTITAGSNTAATFSNQALTTLQAGDILQLAAPGLQDQTLADVGITVLTAKV